jgi:hypothetical protein
LETAYNNAGGDTNGFSKIFNVVWEIAALINDWGQILNSE